MSERPSVLPSLASIKALHRSYAASDEQFHLVYTHCQIVRDIALQLAPASSEKLDLELVEKGSLLHDIGAYNTINGTDEAGRPLDYILHGIEGEKVLKAEGYPVALAHIASHHTGTGLTKQQIIDQRLPLPRQDFVAETPEEELIMYADKFHSKVNPPVFNSYDFYHDFTKQYGQETVRKFEFMACKFGKPTLEGLLQHYGYAIRQPPHE